MRNDLDPLMLDFLQWLAREPRSHADVIEVWRTSCPRLTIWEDAVDRGYATRQPMSHGPAMITPTAAGWQALRQASDARALQRPPSRPQTERRQ